MVPQPRPDVPPHAREISHDHIEPYQKQPSENPGRNNGCGINPAKLDHRHLRRMQNRMTVKRQNPQHNRRQDQRNGQLPEPRLSGAQIDRNTP